MPFKKLSWIGGAAGNGLPRGQGGHDKSVPAGGVECPTQLVKEHNRVPTDRVCRPAEPYYGHNNACEILSRTSCRAKNCSLGASPPDKSGLATINRVLRDSGLYSEQLVKEHNRVHTN
jgi:hypothetical protein